MASRRSSRGPARRGGAARRAVHQGGALGRPYATGATSTPRPRRSASPTPRGARAESCLTPDRCLRAQPGEGGSERPSFSSRPAAAAASQRQRWAWSLASVTRTTGATCSHCGSSRQQSVVRDGVLDSDCGWPSAPRRTSLVTRTRRRRVLRLHRDLSAAASLERRGIRIKSACCRNRLQ